MKKGTILLVLVMSTVLAFSQESTFNKGDKVINLGIGLGSTLYRGSYYSTSVPPLSVSFEKGIVDGVIDKGVIGIGGYAGFSSYKWEYYGWGYKYSNFVLGARGTFHYPFLDKLDTYTGLLLGFRIVTDKEFGNSIPGYDYSTTGSGLAFSWFVGGRYYFTEKLAGMLELGYGISYLNLGVALKL
jgi:hypothetical protein